MKKITLLLLLALVPALAFTQKKEIKDKFKEYTEKKVYTIDNENIVVSKVISGLEGTPDEIYIKVKNYFTRAYNDASSVLQTDDKESGTIIGKGYYRNVYVFKVLGITNTLLSCYHILRVDIKDGRMRVICSVDTWETHGGDGKKWIDATIVDHAPITDKRFFDKGKQMEAFVELIEKMNRSIEALEKSVKEGSLSVETENW